MKKWRTYFLLSMTRKDGQPVLRIGWGCIVILVLVYVGAFCLGWWQS